MLLTFLKCFWEIVTINKFSNFQNFNLNLNLICVYVCVCVFLPNSVGKDAHE